MLVVTPEPDELPVSLSAVEEDEAEADDNVGVTTVVTIIVDPSALMVVASEVTGGRVDWVADC